MKPCSTTGALCDEEGYNSLEVIIISIDSIILSHQGGNKVQFPDETTAIERNAAVTGERVLSTFYAATSPS